MRSKWTRFILLFLVTVSVAAFAGCSNVISLFRNAETTQAESVYESMKTDILDPNQMVYDLNGYKWTWSMPWASKYLPVNDNSETDDELKNMYDIVRDYYNVDIEIKPSEGLNDYMAAGASKTSFSDVIGVSSYEIVPLAVNGYIYSVKDPVMLAAGMNSEDRNRWFSDISRLITWNEKQWTVQLNSAYDMPEFGSFILYNKQIVDKLEDNIYNTVSENRWTNDKYIELADKATKDTDYDGKTDVYGSIILHDIDPLIANSGQLLTEHKGKWQNNVNNAFTIEAVNELAKLLESDVIPKATEQEAVNLFCENKVAFLWVTSSVFTDYPRLAETDGLYGVLPIPNDNGGEFIFPVTSYTGYAFMTANKELNKSVEVFNILSEKFHRDWMSDYIKNSRLDANSADILNMAVSNMVFNNAALDLSIMKIYDEFMSVPLSAGGDIKDIVDNTSSAVESLISLRNSENAVGR